MNFSIFTVFLLSSPFFGLVVDIRLAIRWWGEGNLSELKHLLISFSKCSIWIIGDMKTSKVSNIYFLCKLSPERQKCATFSAGISILSIDKQKGERGRAAVYAT